jgi:hypothetical protein
MVEAARWRTGALRFNASLNLSNVGYDTDVYYGYLDEPTPDFTLTARVPFQALLPLSKKVVLEVNESPEYMFYLETEKERAWNNVLSGRIHFALEKLYVQAGGILSNVRRRMGPEFDVNVREKSDRLDGTVLWQASRSTSFAAIYEFTRYDYTDNEFSAIDLAETQNREESYFDVVTYVQPSTKIRLLLDGQYGLYTFTEPASNVRDTRSYGIFGGLDFVPREGEVGPIEPPQGSVSLGYKRFDVLDANYSDGSGFVGAVNISTGILEKTVVRAFFSRDFDFSVYSDATFYLSTAIGGGLSRRLSRKTTFGYDVNFGRSAYPIDEATGLPTSPDYSYVNHAFNLDVRLARYLSLTFQVTLNERTLGESGERESRDFFGFSLVYGAPSGSISAPARGLSR